jgi:hypothetical protein
MNTRLVIPPALAEELRYYTQPATSREFTDSGIARDFHIWPGDAADRLLLIAAVCLAAGFNLAPLIEELESHTGDPTGRKTIGRMTVNLRLATVIAAAQAATN